MTGVDEVALELFICDYLIGSDGYDLVKAGAGRRQPDFDVARALDTAELFTFIGSPRADASNPLARVSRA